MIPDDDPSDGKPATPTWPAPPPARRVLLAEDDDELRELMASALTRTGFELIEARDGAELLNRIADDVDDRRAVPEIDVVVSDIRMPGMTGLGALCALNGVGCRTPVILITAFGTPAVRAAASRLGAVAVLNKPFRMDDLCALVTRAVEERASAQ